MGSLADHIERYIKQLLIDSRDQAVEINRSQLAEDFACVPSQINYVLTTRFTGERGYIVESRRGGGGYIRIVKVTQGPSGDGMIRILQKIGEAIEEREAHQLVGVCVELGMLSPREAQRVIGIIQRETAGFTEYRSELRASLLRSLLLVLLHR